MEETSFEEEQEDDASPTSHQVVVLEFVFDLDFEQTMARYPVPQLHQMLRKEMETLWTDTALEVQLEFELGEPRKGSLVVPVRHAISRARLSGLLSRLTYRVGGFFQVLFVVVESGPSKTNCRNFLEGEFCLEQDQRWWNGGTLEQISESLLLEIKDQ